MNKYNPDIHKRRSIRLRGYDYSQQGLYFVTLCVKDRAHLFGEIENEKMRLNENGIIVQNEWLKTIELRQNVQLHEFVVMPNHFHTIFEITHQIGVENNGGIGRGVLHTPIHNDSHVGVCTPIHNDSHVGVCNTPLRSPSNTVGAIIRGFKSAVSRQIGFSIWQRDMYEHIIRNVSDYDRIADYIENNPINWKTDRFY
jgi:REP element-mobilizing transposase RayT